MNMYPLGQPRTHRISIEFKTSVYGLPGVVLDIGETGCLIWRRSSQLAAVLRTKHARFVSRREVTTEISLCGLAQTHQGHPRHDTP